MILGWLTDYGVDERLLESALPAPHVALYLDGAPVVVRAPGAEVLVVRQVDANEATIVGGLNESGEPAMEVTITIREVFHGILVDRAGLDFRFRPCGEAPSTSWQQCE